jgi:hypothetical protein
MLRNRCTAAAASAGILVDFGERVGQKGRRVGRGFGYETSMAKGRRCCSVNGFTIHANRYLGQKERTKLEKLRSYCGRGAFANERNRVPLASLPRP